VEDRYHLSLKEFRHDLNEGIRCLFSGVLDPGKLLVLDLGLVLENIHEEKEVL
jgi:hypothetical protein